ncbi:MAG TPA: acyltransferase [Silvibacterium sp.]|nr:acyltransferase [Silvibacterium sp.]
MASTAPSQFSASRSAGESTPTRRIPTLDGWRGIAILMVIACHASMTLGLGASWIESLGNQGVTIFFVLSGFLITSRLLTERQLHRSINLRSFYIRRFFRLMPAAWIYLLFRVLLALENHGSIASVYVVPSLLCFRNYAPVFAAPAATAHFWSLSIEEQFYLAWPALLLLGGRKKAFWIAAFGSTAIALWRFHCWTWLLNIHPQARYETQFRADALLVGCAAALLFPRIQPLLRKWMAVPLLLAIGYNVVIASPLVPLYESASIALLIIITCQNPAAAFSRVLDSKLLSSIGLVSYSLYLWQETLFLAHTAAGTLAVLLLMIVAALVSYFFIEQPSIEWGKNIARRRTAHAASIQAAPLYVE